MRGEWMAFLLPVREIRRRMAKFDHIRVEYHPLLVNEGHKRYIFGKMLVYCILLLVVVAACQPVQYVTFGRSWTGTLGSPQTIFGSLNDNVWRTFFHQINNITGGLMINGTRTFFIDDAHDDGASCDTMRYLYNSYVKNDGATYLIAPVQPSCTDLALIAEQNNVLYANGADYTLPVLMYQYPTPPFNTLQWAFNTMPDQRLYGTATAQAATDLLTLTNPNGGSPIKPRTVVAAYNVEIPYLVDGYLKGMLAQGLTQLGNTTVWDLSEILAKQCEYLEPTIDEWMRLKPDVVIATSGASNSSILVTCMHQKLYHPPMLILPVPSTPTEDFPAWHLDGVMSEASFVASQNFSDPVFGSIDQFEELYRKMHNFTPSSYEVTIVAGGIVIADCMMRTQSIDPYDVRECMRTYNAETLYGPTSFFGNGLYVNRTSINQQYVDGGQTTVATWPLTWPNQTNAKFPYKFVFPSAWEKVWGGKSKKISKDKLLAITLPVGIVGAFGFVALIIIGILYRRFYVIIIGKDDASKRDNWADV